ncbi:MAG: histidinol phosphate phosphatase domain-containing protein [Methanomicrobiales archaeon]|nr:histidinol phosphate phosphatase domain-containing protein [Methanomicrobiales archaeon]
MYDFHTHTLLSDGELLPSELLRRMKVQGYSVVAITDHVDQSNVTETIRALEKMRSPAERMGIKLLLGVELTHVSPCDIPSLAECAKRKGADIVVVHGETPVEPVAPGTNHAAVTCRYVDILAHPGFISDEDAILASKNCVALEITARGGHNRTNGHVVRTAETAECLLVVDSDAHSPSDIMSEHERSIIARGAGVSHEKLETVLSIEGNEFYHRFT